MAAKRILMGFCSLYALARCVGTVLYYLFGAGQLQLAVLIIASDMYDNRGATVKEANSNKTLECILGMYSKNLLPSPEA